MVIKRRFSKRKARTTTKTRWSALFKFTGGLIGLSITAEIQDGPLYSNQFRNLLNVRLRAFGRHIGGYQDLYKTEFQLMKSHFQMVTKIWP